MKAWLHQDHRQKAKLGAEACPWSVGWIDPDGKRCSKRIGSESNAAKYQRKIEGQLAAGTYQDPSSKTWEAFRKEYEADVASSVAAGSKATGTLEAARIALDHFQRIIKPKKLSSIKTKTFSDYKKKRREEKGNGSAKVSPATINKELRTIKAAIQVAVDWEWLARLPKVQKEKEPVKDKPFVTPEHFTAIYSACDVATLPNLPECSAANWWRALLVFNYMTGWRASEPLALRWDDVSLDKATAMTRHQDNKGKRDEIVPLHPLAVDHLRNLADMSIHYPTVFWWPHHRRTLWTEFYRIQVAAGIKTTCGKEDEKGHRHNTLCGLYGFHALRRAFATQNAATLSADDLQRLMRHRSYSTTQRYISMARRLNTAVAKLHVPDLLRGKSA